jgi:hypothetical protein
MAGYAFLFLLGHHQLCMVIDTTSARAVMLKAAPHVKPHATRIVSQKPVWFSRNPKVATCMARVQGKGAALQGCSYANINLLHITASAAFVSMRS